MRKLLLWGGVLASVLGSLCLSPFGFGAVVALDLGLAIKVALLSSVVTAVLLAILQVPAKQFRRPFMLMGRWGIGAAAVLCLLLVSWPALAQTAATAASTVDLTSVVNQVIATLVLAVGAFASYLVKRAVVALEGLHVLQTNSVSGATIDSAVSDAVAYVQSKLQALADPHAQLTMANTILAEAASLVATTAPQAVAALGLTPQAIASKIQLALGDPLAAAAAPAAATTSPPAPAPAPAPLPVS